MVITHDPDGLQLLAAKHSNVAVVAI
jgi:hypothetical protein